MNDIQRFIPRFIILSLFIFAVGCASVDPRTAAFFLPGPTAPAGLPSDAVFPQGRIMHIGGYSVGKDPVKQLGGIVPMELAKESGFTVAGPYYGSFAGARAVMEHASGLGLHVAAQLEVPPALHFKKGEDALKLRAGRMAALTDAGLRAWVQEDMNNFLTNAILNKAVSCWAIAPEELRCWYKPELNYQQVFTKAVNDFDPMHRPVYMYEPNHRNTEALLKTGQGQGFIVEGAYVHNLGWNVSRALRINWAMDQMTGAAAKDKRVIVPGLELSQDLPGFSAKDLERDPAARNRLNRLLRHDVYLAIARGAQGFQVWSLHPFRTNMTTYLDLMKGYGEVFRELALPQFNLQEPILFGERRQDITLTIVKGREFIAAPPKTGSLEAVEGKIDVQKDRWPSVRLANIAIGNQRVLILVNSAAEAMDVRLTGIPSGAKLDTVSGGDTARVGKFTGGVNVAMEPFAAMVLRVRK